MFTGSSPLGVIAARLRLAYGRTGKSTPFSTHLITNIPLDIPVERFLSILRFENRGKLGDLGLEIDINTLISND